MSNVPSINTGATVFVDDDKYAYFVNAIVGDRDVYIERAKAVPANASLFVPLERYKYRFERYKKPRVIHIRYAYGSWWVMDDMKRDYKIGITFGYMQEYISSK